jgi:hypothetical protein
MSFFSMITEMFFFPLLVVLAAILTGQLIGIYHRKKSPDISSSQIACVVGIVFSLLAFILAFNFQIVSSRYDRRKALYLDEITNIRTTYLRAGLVPEPFRSGTKKHLVEYVNLRVEFAEDPAKIDYGLARSQVILDTCWKYAEALAAQDRNSEMYSLYISSVNDLIDNYNQRITMTLEYRTPAPIVRVLLLVIVLAMLLLGYQFGISEQKSFAVNLLLAIIFALVMFLIMALDRPGSGVIRLNQKPLLKLQKQLNEMQVKAAK